MMKKIDRVHGALLRDPVDKFPIFMAATPQFLVKCVKNAGFDPTESLALQSWRYCVRLELDVVQVGHPSFYPVKVLEFPEGTRYTDDFQRIHVITGYYDEFTAPFPLQATNHVDLESIKARWNQYTFPDPLDPKWFGAIDEIVTANRTLADPLSVWGVINGPLEPTWQLLSDGWPAFFILARRDRDLAVEIIERVTDYCIQAGEGMIAHGADAIRIGDDYALNDRLMCAPDLWHELIFPAHQRLVRGLKQAGGQNFPVILHSDGNITPIFQWLAVGGIDALNPIQPDALDFESVVHAVGDQLAMTGAFDLRLFLQPLSHEVEASLRAEVQRLFSIVEDFNQGDRRTGFCIGPSHQVQPGSHVETFEAWIRIIQKYNSS